MSCTYGAAFIVDLHAVFGHSVVSGAATGETHVPGHPHIEASLGLDHTMSENEGTPAAGRPPSPNHVAVATVWPPPVIVTAAFGNVDS
jgi:hypothetical protein